MNPLLHEFLGALIRAGLLWLSGYLVNAKIITGGQAEIYITAATGFVLTVGWSFWEKSRSRKKLLTALMLPPGTTEDELQQYLKSGGVVPASNTPSNTPPGIP